MHQADVSEQASCHGLEKPAAFATAVNFLRVCNCHRKCSHWPRLLRMRRCPTGIAGAIPFLIYIPIGVLMTLRV
jgi:hypothetical protein